MNTTETPDGFTSTMKALRKLKVNMKGVPLSIARMIYDSGVAFSSTDPTTEEDRRAWRGSIIVKIDK